MNHGKRHRGRTLQRSIFADLPCLFVPDRERSDCRVTDQSLAGFSRNSIVPRHAAGSAPQTEVTPRRVTALANS